MVTESQLGGEGAGESGRQGRSVRQHLPPDEPGDPDTHPDLPGGVAAHPAAASQVLRLQATHLRQDHEDHRVPH